MNYKLIIIIIVIIIIALLLLKEDFEITDNVAFNNLITSINDKNLNIENINTTSTLTTNGTLEASVVGDNIKKELMKEIYPVGSLFLAGKYYNENNTDELKGTPLYYGKWKLIDEVGVIGTAKNDYKPKTDDSMFGYKKIEIQHIPPHKHKYQMRQARSAKYNSNYEYAANWNVDNFSYPEIYDKNNKLVNQVDYNPYGYYVFTYRKIEL